MVKVDQNTEISTFSIFNVHLTPGAFPGHVSGAGFNPFKTGGTSFDAHSLLAVNGWSKRCGYIESKSSLNGQIEILSINTSASFQDPVPACVKKDDDSEQM